MSERSIQTSLDLTLSRQISWSWIWRLWPDDLSRATSSRRFYACCEAFINKLRSVVVTATLLEGFQRLSGGTGIWCIQTERIFYHGISSVSVGDGVARANAGADRNAFGQVGWLEHSWPKAGTSIQAGRCTVK